MHFSLEESADRRLIPSTGGCHSTKGEGILRSSLGTLLELEKSLTSLSGLWRMVEDRSEQSHEPLIGTQLLLSPLPDSRSPLQRPSSQQGNDCGNLGPLSGTGSCLMGEIKEHWSRKPRHLDKVPSYLYRRDNRASLTWVDCWMGWGLAHWDSSW